MQTQTTQPPGGGTFSRWRGQDRKPSRRGSRLSAAVLTVALVAAGGVVTATPAEAASGGVGWGTFGDRDTAYAGTFTQDGVNLICGDPGADYPTSHLNDAGLWTNFKGITGDKLAGLNRVFTEYGGTSDRNTAAALFYATHRIVDPSAALIDHSGHVQSSYDAVINFNLYRTVGSSNVREIQRIADDLTNIINTTTAGSGGTGSGQLNFALNPKNHYAGTVEMDGTPGSTGSITLDHGVFEDTGLSTRDNVQEGAAYGVRGVPDESGVFYKITGRGRFTPPGQEGYAPNVHVWTPTVGGQQRSLSAGEKASPQPFDVTGFDPADRTTVFQPTLSTTAQAFVQKGAAFADTVRFSTTSDGAGLNNPWYRSPATGRALPITAEGTVYGPFDEPADAPRDTVPAEAPIAGHLQVTTGDAGPDIEYTATSTETAPTAGYYYYVWTIAAATQTAVSKKYLPSDYVFTDKFGLAGEQSVTPMRVSATTQVPAPVVPLSGVPADAAQVTTDGFWLKDADGANLPVTVRWDAYLDPRESGITQVKVDDKPADAVLLGSTTQTVTGAGLVKTPEGDALGFAVPASGKGSIVWVASVRDADQGANADHIEEWSDDYGVPTEIQLIGQPTVATKATPSAQKGAQISDTATVGGVMPATGAQLTFEAYQVPMKQDANGVWQRDVPGGDVSKVCDDPNNRVFSNIGRGAKIAVTGMYTSPTVTASEHGTFLWVESLWSIPTKPGEQPQLISRGECGVPDETTVVLDVSTKASAVDGSNPVTPGTGIQDTASIIGAVPEGATVTFEAFRGESGHPVCSPATLVWTSTTATLTTGYFTESQPQQPVSGAFTPDATSTTTQVWFVETVRDHNGQTIAKGDCGVPDETLTLVPKPTPPGSTTGTPGSPQALAVTGFDGGSMGPWIAAASFGVLVGLALIGVQIVRRRRSSTEPSD